MKKFFLVVVTTFLCIILSGCGKYNQKDLIKDFSKKISDSNSYTLNGILEIINNEDIYSYDVNVSYKKDDNFKVSLKNKVNNYEQIVLRNSEGIYVLTPSLNKSFKFQSEWPYNSSQCYLLQTLLEDMKNDDNAKFEENNGEYIVETKANYSSNKELSLQKIYFNNNKDVTKVEVYDNNNLIKMTMAINSIDYNTSLDNDYFNLNKNIDSNAVKTETSKTIEQVIYPMYIPKNTYLSSENKVSKDDGERIIMTFAGDSSFMLIQETATISDSNALIPVDGEPYLMANSVGAVSDNSIEWVSNGIEYYLVSSSMSKDVLLDVAKSLSVMPVGK